jgi:ABC-type nitrate/sulfonate/bicarbonate transport system substrate-binding protein
MDDADLMDLQLAYFSRSIVSAVAQQRGLYAAQRLRVTESPVQSSPAQFRSLLDGEYDVALTSPDNVAAYRLSADNPLHEQVDVRMLLAVDSGLGLSLVSSGSIRTVADLRGRTVAVDVRESGFALALFDLLAGEGLQPDRDYTVVSLGSTPRRLQALLDGRCDATMLNAGHDVTAEVSGCLRLARISDVCHPYLGTVLASTGPWLEQHADVAHRFVLAWLAAVDVVLDPAERDVVEPMVADLLEVPASGSAQAYETLTSRRDGLVPDGRIDLDALRNVLSLRGREAAASSPGLIDSRLLTSGPAA